jgi:hypothetical protein
MGKGMDWRFRAEKGETMDPSLATLFAEVICRYYDRHNDGHLTHATDDMMLFRQKMCTLAGMIAQEEDIIWNKENAESNEKIREEIITVAADCFYALEMIGNLPLDRIARELGIPREYAESYANLAASYRGGNPLVVHIQGAKGESAREIREAVEKILQEKTPDQK